VVYGVLLSQVGGGGSLTTALYVRRVIRSPRGMAWDDVRLGFVGQGPTAPGPWKRGRRSGSVDVGQRAEEPQNPRDLAVLVDLGDVEAGEEHKAAAADLP